MRNTTEYLFFSFSEISASAVRGMLYALVIRADSFLRH